MKVIFLFLFLLYSGITIAQFSPIDIKPSLWLDSSNDNQFDLSGNKVRTWFDKSGNQNHAVAPETNSQPSKISTGGGVQFDGIDDLLLSSNISYGQDGGITVFAVVKADSYSGDEQLKKWIVSKGAYTGGAPYGLLQNYAGLHAVVSGKSIVMKKDDMKMHVLCQKFNGEEISSEADGEEFPWYTAAPSNNSNKVGIGSNDGGSKYPFFGKIYEVLIFQKLLSECEISTINGYLANKWKDITLAKNHPFNNNSIDICEGGNSFSVNENSPNGTSVGTLNLISVSNNAVQASNWKIADQLFAGLFAINSTTGEITVADNSKLDFELVSSHVLKIETTTNDGLLTTEINIDVDDGDDGDAAKQTSLLWGDNGELWDPRGRLPDFSFAGFDSGKSEIPTYTNEVNITSYGAVADDDKSDVAAIQKAVNEAPDNSVIVIPRGKFVIDAPITIKRNNIVIKGVTDEADGSVFYLPLSATEYSGKYDGSYSTGDEGAFIAFEGGYASTVARITEDVKRGDRTVTVDKTSSLSIGQIICVTGTDGNPTNGELWHELHNNQDEDWSCALDWATGDGGPMYHTIERIYGNLVTFKEPLKINIKASWNMALQKAVPGLINVGIENIRFNFIKVPKAEHLSEPGYNGVQFTNCVNFWARNLTMNNCDNGIRVKKSTFGEVADVLFIGREGHHGFSFTYSSNNIAHNFRFENEKEYVHSVTFTHKSNGNVLYDVSGTKVISLDFHRNAPFSNLICEVKSTWNNASSGTFCAGAHAGARNVYWNLYGEADEIRDGNEAWGQYQNTLVSKLKIAELYHPEREWYEDVAGLQPSNLYLAQLNKRLTAPADPLFMADQKIGNRNNWFERDPSRWKIRELNGQTYYSLYFNDFPSLSGGKPGEYAIYNETVSGNFKISAKVISQEDFERNPDADIILIACYKNDNNYLFGRISSDLEKSGICSVTNGVVTQVKAASKVLSDNGEHTFSFAKDQIYTRLFLDGAEIASTDALSSVSGGKPGIGSTDDAVLFDDVKIDLTYTTSVAESKIQKQIKVYPNPTNDVLNISLFDETQIGSLYDMTGSLVKSGIKEQVNISDLKDGVYCLVIEVYGKRFVGNIVKK